MLCATVSDVHEKSAVSTMPASWEVVCCWAPHPVLSITSGFSNTTTRQRGITTTAVGRRSCYTHENCMHAEQIIIIFYIFNYIFCSMYLLFFSIVLYRTIVTVYTENIFLYNYLWQIRKQWHPRPALSSEGSRNLPQWWSPRLGHGAVLAAPKPLQVSK